MGSNDTPPPHVPKHVVPFCTLCLQIGGVLWTIAYLLYLKEAVRSKSCGMPTLALAANFGWELVHTFYVDQEPLEKLVFSIWILIDVGLVRSLLKYGKTDYRLAPRVNRRLPGLFALLLVTATLAHWTFARWWITNEIGKKQGKPFRGSIGADITELSYWSSIVCQLVLGSSSLYELNARGHSGGVSWSIWATRTLGTLIGLVLNLSWAWYFWPEGHGYFMSSLSIFLWTSSVACDLYYPILLWKVQLSEVTLSEGRKISREAARFESSEETH